MHSLSRSLVGSLLASTALIASAQEQTFNLNIPAQPLSTALEALGQKTGLHVFYAAEIIKGKTSQALSGDYSTQQAIEKLLAGSGLTHTFTAKDTIAIKSADSTSSNALPAVKVFGKAIYDSTDPHNPNYNRPNASTATKTDTPIMDTPMSIQVVPRAVMDDQQAISLKDALQNVSGVQWSPVEGSLYENFILRGFDANVSTARNGVRETSFATETANLDRVEVLKGPAAMLYGRVEPGGLINRVTKQALFTPYYSIQQQFGSFDNYRTTIDATAPINSELAYRFNLAYQDNKSYRDYVGNERIFLAPSMTWKPSDRTEFNLTLEYQNDNGRWDDGIPAIGNRPANIPINRYLAYPTSNDKQERELVDFHWLHAFNDDWKLEQRFVASFANQSQRNQFPWGLDFNNRSLYMGYWDAAFLRDTYSQNINLSGHIDTWGAKHTLLVGYDFYIFDQALNTPSSHDHIPALDLLIPNYSAINGVNLNPAMDSFGYSGQTWHGIYLQDQIKLWDKLHFLLGGRYDWAEIGSAYGANSASQAQSLSDQSAIHADKFNPRFGILYQPWKWMSLYGNYTESMGANNGRDNNNVPLKPQLARQFEAGIKNEFFDGRLTSTLAFFDIVKSNIQAGSLNPADKYNGTYSTIGAARSRGIEYDLSGKLTENVSLIANYAWTDTRIIKDGGQCVWDMQGNDCTFLPNGFVGNRLPLVPVHSANMWLKYEFSDEMFKGVSVGTGARLASQTQGDPNNDYQIPGYVTWNAMAAYKRKIGNYKLTAQFNAYNLLDHRYYAGADQVDQAYRFNIIPGAPANFMGSLRLEF